MRTLALSVRCAGIPWPAAAGGGIPTADRRSTASIAWITSLGITEIHDAVVDERRRLVDAGLHDARPDQLQRLDVGLVDLVERTVAPRLIVAAMDRPILGLGRAHHRIGRGDEIRHGLESLGRPRRRRRGRRRLGRMHSRNRPPRTSRPSAANSGLHASSFPSWVAKLCSGRETHAPARAVRRRTADGIGRYA